MNKRTTPNGIALDGYFKREMFITKKTRLGRLVSLSLFRHNDHPQGHTVFSAELMAIHEHAQVFSEGIQSPYFVAQSRLQKFEQRYKWISLPTSGIVMPEKRGAYRE